MQSSGTSTPAGDSPGPGRAFLRTTDFTPEIVPPRLRRTTYPAGQSPLVLPGLTRASSSFTITSNHQNILPLWPAAPPPGQPVVFFCPLSGVRPACFPSARRHGLPRGREGRSRPVPWFMRSALPDTRQGRGFFPFRVPVFEGAAALGHQGRTAFVCGALRCARCRRLAPSARSPLLARMLVQPGHHRWHGARLLAEIRRSSLPHPSFLSWRRRALSACCAAGERQGSHGPHRPR